MPSKLTAIAAGLAALAIAAPAAAQAAPAGGSLAAPAVAKVRPSVPPHTAVKHTRRAPGSRLVIGRKATTTAVTAGSTSWVSRAWAAAARTTGAVSPRAWTSKGT